MNEGTAVSGTCPHLVGGDYYCPRAGYVQCAVLTELTDSQQGCMLWWHLLPVSFPSGQESESLVKGKLDAVTGRS